MIHSGAELIYPDAEYLPSGLKRTSSLCGTEDAE